MKDELTEMKNKYDIPKMFEEFNNDLINLELKDLNLATITFDELWEARLQANKKTIEWYQYLLSVVNIENYTEEDIQWKIMELNNDWWEGVEFGYCMDNYQEYVNEYLQIDSDLEKAKTYGEWKYDILAYQKKCRKENWMNKFLKEVN